AVFDKAVAEAEQAGRAGDAAGRLAGLERAGGICQGPLLPSRYDDWIGPARDRVSQRCRDAVASLVALLEEQREYAGATTHVRHWLEHDPLDERAHRWLIRLLALGGDRAGALQAYRRCVDVLKRELGAEPADETVRVYERIRDAPETGAAVPKGGEDAPAGPPLVG